MAARAWGLLDVWTAAQNAGSISAVSIQLSINSAGSDMIVTPFINGAPVGMPVTVSPTSRGFSTTLTPGALPFVGDDIVEIKVQTGTGWSATTAALRVDLEITT